MRTVKRILSTASAALCTATLILLAVDLVKPGLDLFLKDAVKWFLLVTSIVVIAASAVKLANARRKLRRRLARKKNK
jgi:hypothetical protein